MDKARVFQNPGKRLFKILAKDCSNSPEKSWHGSDPPPFGRCQDCSSCFAHYEYWRSNSPEKSWHGSDPSPLFWQCQDFGNACYSNPSLTVQGATSKTPVTGHLAKFPLTFGENLVYGRPGGCFCDWRFWREEDPWGCHPNLASSVLYNWNKISHQTDENYDKKLSCKYREGWT